MGDCLHVRSFIIIYQEYHKLIMKPPRPHTTSRHSTSQTQIFQIYDS